jgi:hypothetical protein
MAKNDTNKLMKKPSNDTSYEANKQLSKSYNNMGEVKQQPVEFISLGTV